MPNLQWNMVRGGGGWGYLLLAGSTYQLLPVISLFLDNISLGLSQLKERPRHGHPFIPPVGSPHCFNVIIRSKYGHRGS